jgi:hypothetical protein
MENAGVEEMLTGTIIIDFPRIHKKESGGAFKFVESSTRLKPVCTAS